MQRPPQRSLNLANQAAQCGPARQRGSRAPRIPGPSAKPPSRPELPLKLAGPTLLNLVGLGVPLLLGLALIPELLVELGPARFGVLGLLWSVAAYFGLFDFGLSNALAQGVATAWSRGDTPRARGYACAGVLMLAGVGALMSVLLLLMAPGVIGLWQQVPDPEAAVNALRVLALGLPFFLLTSGYRGVLEGTQSFLALNALRLPMGAWTFVGPWWVLQVWGPDLVAIAWALAGGRLVASLLYFVAVRRVLGVGAVDRVERKRLLIASGWLTIASAVSPLVAALDRFVLGACVSASAVSHYVTPQEVVSKLTLLPAAMASALMPQWAGQGERDDSKNAPLGVQDRLLGALRPLLLLVLPPLALLAVAAEPLTRLWLRAAFDPAIVPVLQVMCVGLAFNAVAYLPSTWLQARGAFRALAVVQSSLLLPYAMALNVLCTLWGVEGAAWAWTLRMAADGAWLWLWALRTPVLTRAVK